MKNNLNLKIIIIILILVLISLFIYNFDVKKSNVINRHKLKKYYVSDTFVSNNYEVYSEQDAFYPNEKIPLKLKKSFIRLLQYADSFFNENNIEYSLAYGTLLGYIRNKKIIPYDHDLDCIIGINGVKKLKQLAENPEMKTIMYNTQIKKYKPNFKTDTIYIILNHSFINDKGYGKRYNCKGKKVLLPVDRCAVKGFIGRIILNDIQYDIFPYNTDYSIMKQHLHDVSFYPEHLQLLSNLNKYKRDYFEGVEVSVLNDEETDKFLSLFYGNDYLIPKNDTSLKQSVIDKFNNIFSKLNI